MDGPLSGFPRGKITIQNKLAGLLDIYSRRIGLKCTSSDG